MDVKGRLVEMGNGVAVESDALRVAQKVNEYDSNLVIKCLVSSANNPSQAPYALFEKCPDGIDRKVFDIWTLDDRVLERIYAADTRKLDVLGALDRHNSGIRREMDRKYQERKAETSDLIVHMLKNPKTSYTFKNKEGETVKIDDSSNGYNGVVKK